MKKIILSLLALVTMLNTFAQKDWSIPPKLYDQYWMVGVQSGFSQLYGDLSNKSFFKKLKRESKPSYSISFGRQISSVLSVKAEVSKSNYFSQNKILWNDTIKTIHSVTGNITEFGVYGTLNLNKLFSKNKQKADNWNAYFSTGIGFSSWRFELRDGRDSIVSKIKNSIVNEYGWDTARTFRIKTLDKLSFPYTIGANFKLTDRIWLSVQHSYHFVLSDYLDGKNDYGFKDIYSTTTVGITLKLQKPSASLENRNGENSSSLDASQTKSDKPARRSFFKKTPMSNPELQDYSGFNGLLPPPVPKIDTTRKTKAVSDQNTDNFKSQVDSGRFEITGGKTNNMNTEFLTDNNASTGVVPTYRIQIQASKVYIPINTVIETRALTDKISVELRPDGWYRYYIGQYSSLSDAKTKLLELQNKGVKDAFIVSFKTSVRKEVIIKK